MKTDFSFSSNSLFDAANKNEHIIRLFFFEILNVMAYSPTFSKNILKIQQALKANAKILQVFFAFQSIRLFWTFVVMIILGIILKEQIS